MMTMTQPKQPLKRGDIVLVLFPNSDLVSAKTRPALIVQADNLRTGLSQIIVAMITSQMFRAGHPSRVPVWLDSPEGQQSGLLTLANWVGLMTLAIIPEPTSLKLNADLPNPESYNDIKIARTCPKKLLAI